MRKKNDKTTFCTVDNSRSVVNDFRLRCTDLSYESYRPVDYRLYSGLTNEVMMPKLKEHIDKLLSGEVDDANGDMLDRLLFAPARIALPDLNLQHIDHIDSITRFINRRKADLKDLQANLVLRQKELEALTEDYEVVSTMITDLGGIV